MGAIRGPRATDHFPAELRSCHPHVAFDATFQFWQQGSDQATFWTTRQEITAWADQVTARYCVTQAGNAENEINTSIANGVRVRLAVGPQARAAAEAFLEIDRQAALEHVRQRAELERIRYLRESVYSRPDVARSCWLCHHPDQLNAMLDIDFEGIAEKFGDVRESRFLVIAELIGDFLGRLEDGERRYLVGQLGQLFSSYDRPDLAEQLEAS
ncbi:MAG TPA: hypothetical protein VFB84_12695 [Micromonosporaceae bacterium]|nr:hypothetical protein [Micromonosporaceae bacterium]